MRFSFSLSYSIQFALGRSRTLDNLIIGSVARAMIYGNKGPVDHLTLVLTPSGTVFFTQHILLFDRSTTINLMKPSMQIIIH